MSKSILGNIKYESLPLYSEKSQLTDLFLVHKFWGWIGLLIIFILICTILFFQFKIWESEDKLITERLKDWKENSRKERK